ncbi:hypothetical protein IX332_000748 [Porphyromonas levii]|uniref:glycosyltransferase family A protein n=1 Tax=Porphyromonas levii TaxID=28114 RepID=UPI001B8CADDE|nr:glycosyltransferase family 2 protein [Porphyromonas levii]MBR8729428.1 hypothetical protein [Porphyromonas levii]
MSSINVILPTYRPGAYIYECIDSVAQQQCDAAPFTYHLDIILNGDKEPYFSEISTYITVHRVNATITYTDIKGVSNARNMGIELSSDYDYIAFIDDDDLFEENYLSELHGALKGKPNAIAHSLIKYLGENGISENYTVNNLVRHLSEDGTRYTPFRYRKLLNSACSKLYPLELIGNDMRFDTSLKFSEDSLFVFDLTRKIKEIVLVPTTAYVVREREGSATRTKYSARALVKRSILFIKKLTATYFSAHQKYSFLLYMSRALGRIKAAYFNWCHNK